MKNIETWKKELATPAMLEKLAKVYCCPVESAGVWADRLNALCCSYEKTFGKAQELALFSAPGRTEIGGNHTDHQHGCVLAGSVNLDTVAAVALNGENVIRIQSEGHALNEVSLDVLTPSESEFGSSDAIIRGVASRFAEMGCELKGFNAYTTSSVLTGSGLSSSAAFEVLVGTIINELFFDKKATAVEIAQIGQYAENVFFGKPCGLMDQTACSVGNMITIDFNDPSAPLVESIDFDFAATGHALCILDSGASHADLTDEYAAITREMKSISRLLGKEFLRDVPEAEFVAAIPMLREKVGDRAVLRALHFFADNERVPLQVEALRAGDFEKFLSLVNASGRSSWLYLQNVVPSGYTEHQEVALTLALCAALLDGRGASRVHGGGFAGTVQAFVPFDLLDDFIAGTEAVLGKGACHVLSIRPVGGIRF
ncbi:MAG: galactokinase [Oscillospiraceae bacterium]|nr:galactokinase [Oscillospiraceae bacterium]